MYILGCLYKNGQGVYQDDREAIKCFHSAALLGDDEAMVQLVDYYEQGFYINRDEIKIIYWLKEASKLGNTQAKERLKKYETPIYDLNYFVRNI